MSVDYLRRYVGQKPVEREPPAPTPDRHVIERVLAGDDGIRRGVTADRRQTAERQADQHRHQERRHRQPERVREALAQERLDRAVVELGAAEVTETTPLAPESAPVANARSVSRTAPVVD